MEGTDEMPEWTRRFDQRAGEHAHDSRLDAAAFHRNRDPILAIARKVLTLGEPGHALEIASGTGQHAVAFAETFPDLVWWPTDAEPAHVESIEAWRRHAGLPNIMPARVLDASARDWTFEGDDQPPLGNLSAILAINITHIAPFAVTLGILSAAGRYLKPGGALLFYGPFTRGGAHTADSNQRFDASLKAQDPSWGVRDIAEIEAPAARDGLFLAAIHEMPANNFILEFDRP
ncbi:DUF938 domain-containing protein [Rhodobium orientis]|nr:DUF938 domain-containing protein [Rhodobium orientis]